MLSFFKKVYGLVFLFIFNYCWFILDFDTKNWMILKVIKKNITSLTFDQDKGYKQH